MAGAAGGCSAGLQRAQPQQRALQEYPGAGDLGPVHQLTMPWATKMAPPLAPFKSITSEQVRSTGRSHRSPPLIKTPYTNAASPAFVRLRR